MAKTFNKTILIGRVAEDIVLKQDKDNRDYARFTVLNTTVDEDHNEVVQSHSLIAFGKQARVCAEYLGKGDLCCVEGELNRKLYEDNGEQKYKVEVVAERVTFLSPSRKKESVSV